MIKIFNKKKGTEITIDETYSWIKLIPKDYEDQPYVKIEMDGFDLLSHSIMCNDCKLFIDAIGTSTVDWIISYMDKTFRLDLSKSIDSDQSKSKIQYKNSNYEYGTNLTLYFHELPIDKNELEKLLNNAVAIENYENACVIRDIIKDE